MFVLATDLAQKGPSLVPHMLVAQDQCPIFLSNRRSTAQAVNLDWLTKESPSKDSCQKCCENSSESWCSPQIWCKKGLECNLVPHMPMAWNDYSLFLSSRHSPTYLPTKVYGTLPTFIRNSCFVFTFHRKISRNDLLEYIGKHYSAPRMVLAAAGGKHEYDR